MRTLIPIEVIDQLIFAIRDRKVMLDEDLARLYGVETKALTRAVKRNKERFPADFMFQLTNQEVASLRCQFGTLKGGRGQHRKYLPYVFTEQGVAMLSSVLNSKRAIRVNVEIMREFVRLRKIMFTHKDLIRKIDDMERKYDTQFKIVFDAIRQMMIPPEKEREKIGFLLGKKRN